MIAFFSSLPPEHFSLLRLVADEASARGVAAYVVGGFVRDLILKRPGLDFDIVVEGDAPALARALAKKHGGKVTAHTRFHTATWFLSTNYQFTKSRSTNLPPFLDLITARRESYARPGSLPDVTPSTIDDDLRRRDFTINTLAVRLDGAHFGELYDPQHGAADIEDGIIRVLHDASFSDDPTRILRAVRYEQRYGFQIEAHTLGLLPASRALLGQLSAERARHELDLILEEPRAAAMLARLEELGLLKAVAGQLPWNANISRRLDSVVDAIPTLDWKIGEPRSDIPMRRVLGYSLWLMDLAPDAIEALQSRLAFPLGVLKPVQAAARLRVDLPALSGAKPSRWVERLEMIPPAAIFAVYLSTGETALETYALSWRTVRAHTDGEALKALGVPAGPAYKKILLRLRAAWLDGEVASAQQEKELLDKLLT